VRKICWRNLLQLRPINLIGEGGVVNGGVTIWGIMEIMNVKGWNAW
jgi:hypothetical protein